MLSIKHVDGGNESVITAVSVSYDKTGNYVTAFRSPGGSDPVHYSSGRVYVMNENGKTIGAYILTDR